VAEVQQATGGKGVNVIIENVAADNLAKDLRRWHPTAGLS
jgi:hypothetical protein